MAWPWLREPPHLARIQWQMETAPPLPLCANSRPPRDSMQVFVTLIFSHFQLFPNKQEKNKERNSLQKQLDLDFSQRIKQCEREEGLAYLCVWNAYTHTYVLLYIFLRQLSVLLKKLNIHIIHCNPPDGRYIIIKNKSRWLKPCLS